MLKILSIFIASNTSAVQWMPFDDRAVERLIVTIVWWACHVATSARRFLSGLVAAPIKREIIVTGDDEKKKNPLRVKKVYLAFSEREHTRWTRDYTPQNRNMTEFISALKDVSNQ